MTDEKRNAYQHSVRKAVRADLNSPPTVLPDWVLESLFKLFGDIPTRIPYTVLAMYGVRRSSDAFRDREIIETQLLLQNGWDLEMSVLIYKNFRLAHPVLRYDPQMWRTFSRQQLRDELGVTFGNVMADICADPYSQPVFSALMFGDLDAPIQQTFVKHQLGFAVDSKVLVASAMSPRVQLDYTGITAEDLRTYAIAMPTIAAIRDYRKLTGQDYVEPSLNPRTYDYDQAAIRAALRQADCHFDPYSQESYQG